MRVPHCVLSAHQPVRLFRRCDGGATGVDGDPSEVIVPRAVLYYAIVGNMWRVGVAGEASGGLLRDGGVRDGSSSKSVLTTATRFRNLKCMIMKRERKAGDVHASRAKKRRGDTLSHDWSGAKFEKSQSY